MLSNVRQEKFAQAMAKGMTLEAAHREAGYSGHRGTAFKLSTQPHISARIDELQEKAAKTEAITKDELIQFLADVVKTPAGHVHKEHPLCQSFKDTESCNEVRMPDKLGAVAQLCKMTGWHQEEKVSVSVDGLQDLLLQIRSGAKA